MSRFAVIAVTLAACRFADPPIIGSTDWKCDPTHDCGEGAQCIAGVCNAPEINFYDGWQNRSELGCDRNALLDRDFAVNTPDPHGAATGFLDDPGVPAICTASNGHPDAEVIEDDGPLGAQTRMLRVRQSTGHVNGTDFTLGQQLAMPVGDFYASWWVKYSANWQWAAADHGNLVAGALGTQISFGAEGRGNSDPAFVRIYVAASDTNFDATTAQMSVGVWHFCELHVVSGVHGKVEARIDHDPVMFVSPNEAGKNVLDVDTGPMIGGGFIETDYGAGDFLTMYMDPANPWFSYYDDVRMGDGSAF